MLGKPKPETDGNLRDFSILEFHLPQFAFLALCRFPFAIPRKSSGQKGALLTTHASTKPHPTFVSIPTHKPNHGVAAHRFPKVAIKQLLFSTSTERVTTVRASGRFPRVEIGGAEIAFIAATTPTKPSAQTLHNTEFPHHRPVTDLLTKHIDFRVHEHGIHWTVMACQTLEKRRL